MLLPEKYYIEAKKMGFIKTGWEMAEKNNQLKRLKKYMNMGFTNAEIEKLNMEYWVVGNMSFEPIEVVY